ncbi:hypothetical protein GMB51_02500 [Turicibacter sanguinis]|nr:hypothetical protein [Turicibacter sanguinis]MTN49817.1 hypothetical protein [Turicibacter sanguinis]MTN52848.1 hypothetical protein [Turicibacter sanguinis]MTN56098.1 hypothetical protein [Turicibacter sanguinis]MTN59162.1 hypothetical protein [Turicibacter sanguinis]
MSENKRSYSDREVLTKLHECWDYVSKRYEKTLKIIAIELIIELKNNCHTYIDLFEAIDALENEVLWRGDIFPEMRKKVFEDIRMHLRIEMSVVPVRKLTLNQLSEQFGLKPLGNI